ncbi:MAG: NfeD family protein [Alphaproteobacteria bacterium]|nr:NfeD family protein [Alphaproteobacteria bacterium]
MFFNPVTIWLLVGLLLSLLELVVPGTYLIWFGFAAFAMSILVFAVTLDITAQLFWFALFSAVFAIIGLFAYRYIFKRTQTPKEYQNLNDSAKQMVGRKVTVSEDSEDNQTKVKIGDTYWLAYSEKPFKKGDTAKVIGVKDSLILIIE